MLRRAIPVLVCAALSAVPTASMGQPATLQQAARKVLASHPALIQGLREVDARSAEQDQALAQRWPTLSADLSGEPGSPRQNLGTWRVEQPLWAGGRITGGIEVASTQLRAAQADVRQTAQDLLARLVQQWFEVVRLEARERVAADNLLEHRRLLDLISRRSSLEVSARIDVAVAQARVQQAGSEHLTTQSLLQQARGTLELLTGERLPDRLAAGALPGPFELTPEQALATALAHAPGLEYLRHRALLASQQAELKRAERWPTVSLRYERQAGPGVPVGVERWGLALQYQPGAGLTGLHGADAAQRRSLGAQGALAWAEQELRVQVLNQRLELDTMAGLIQPARESVVATTQIAESFLRQFGVGRKTWLEVMNAQREKAQAEAAEADAVANLLAAHGRMDLLLGRLDGGGVP